VRLALCALALTVCILALTACGPGAATQSPGPNATVAPTPRPPDVPVATPPPAAIPPVTGVPPAILETVTAEAARLAGVYVDQVTIVSAAPTSWPDGSLGCPQPGEMYTQALVNGFWIVLQAGGAAYDFRVAADGSFRLCPHPVESGGADPY
jgi:hypothetical protein